MVQAHEKKPTIITEELQPKSTIAGYKFTWQERGLLAWSELLPINDRPARGFILEAGYDTLSGREPGARQIDLGTTLTGNVRELMLGQMALAGWREIGRDEKRRPIWQHESRIAATRVSADQDQAEQKIKIDDLQPGKESYWAHWIEEDIQCSVALKALNSNDPARGYTVDYWYVGRASSSRPLSREKQKIATNRASQLRAYFVAQLEQAGWSPIDDIWHFIDRRVAPMSKPVPSAPALQEKQDQAAPVEDLRIELDDFTAAPLAPGLQRSRWYHAKAIRWNVQAEIDLIPARDQAGYYRVQTRIDRQHAAPGAMGKNQRERANALLDQLKKRVETALLDAGWIRHGERWQYGRSLTGEQDQAAPVKDDQVTKKLYVPAREGEKAVKSYNRTITASDVTYTCTRCKNDVTKSLFPGATPLYCDTCAVEVKREQTRERVRRLRAGKKHAS